MRSAVTDISAQFALDTNALAGLKNQAKAAPEQALKSAAVQFEALFMQMLMKSMREALPQDGPFASEATKTYTSMLDQQVAQQLGKKGIGIADMVMKQLSRALPATATDAGAAGAGAPMPLTKKSASFPLPDAKAVAARYAPAAGADSAATPSGRERAGNAATATPGVTVPSAARTPAAKSTAVAPAGALSAVRTFVDKLKTAAEAAGRAAGLPGAYLLAQAGLETGWGRFQPRHADGTESNNLFGIKAGRSWTGPVVEAKTTEFVNGKPVTTVEKFRAYASQAEALQDYAALIGRNPRYANAVASAADPAAFAQGLQKAGYATDPRYAEKLTAAMRMVARHTGPAAAPAQVFAGNAVNRT